MSVHNSSAFSGTWTIQMLYNRNSPAFASSTSQTLTLNARFRHIWAHIIMSDQTVSSHPQEKSMAMWRRPSCAACSSHQRLPCFIMIKCHFEIPATPPPHSLTQITQLNQPVGHVCITSPLMKRQPSNLLPPFALVSNACTSSGVRVRKLDTYPSKTRQKGMRGIR
jgi:hypothetical protein